MAKISPIRQLRALNSSANTPLQQSEAILRASWHISSALASYGGSHPKKRDDESFAAYFRRREGQKQQSTSSEAPSKSSLISQDELSYWHSPHMPILTRQQLELSLLEIRRREREKQKKNDAQHVQSSPATLKKKKEAAILVPLCSVQGVPSILFTRRSAQLSSHASQISFPGGYYDEELDTSTVGDQYGNSSRLVNTALREMHEELQYDLDSLELSQHASDIMDMESKGSAKNNLQSDNIQASAVQHPPLITILGQTQPVPSMTGSKVTPIIGTINYDLPNDTSNDFTTMFPGNPDEVDWIFTVPIQDLIDSETSEPLERWSTNFGDHTANSKHKKKIVASGPVFPVPEGPNKKEGDKIWGLTAIVLRPLLKHVFGPVFGSKRDDATSRL